MAWVMGHLLTGAVTIVAIQSPAGPAVLGPTASRLTPDDLAQISRLADDAGGRIWVIEAPSFGWVRNRWFVRAYLEPAQATGGLRRGVTVNAVADLPAPARFDGPRTWRRDSVAAFAQVAGVGTDSGLVPDARHPNRPFRVYGELTDSEISSLVALIRSSPGILTPATSAKGAAREPADRVQGHWPIAVVTSRADAVEIRLLDEDASERSGQVVALERRRGGWSIQRLSFWVSD